MPWSRSPRVRKRRERSDNVRMREVVGAIERVSARPRFSRGAALSAMPARGGLNITRGRKGAAWGLLLLCCALLAAALVKAGLCLAWCCLNGGCCGHGVLGVGGPCLAQEDAPGCAHSAWGLWEMGCWELWAEPWARQDGGAHAVAPAGTPLPSPLPVLPSQLRFCSRHGSSCERVGFRHLLFSVHWESLKINSLVLGQRLAQSLAGRTCCGSPRGSSPPAQGRIVQGETSMDWA